PPVIDVSRSARYDGQSPRRPRVRPPPCHASHRDPSRSRDASGDVAIVVAIPAARPDAELSAGQHDRPLGAGGEPASAGGLISEIAAAKIQAKIFIAASLTDRKVNRQEEEPGSLARF